MNIIQEGVLRVLPSGIAGFLNLFFMRSDFDLTCYVLANNI